LVILALRQFLLGEPGIEPLRLKNSSRRLLG
jgi:hypothetical protein